MNVLFHQLVHVLNMMSAKILSYSVSDDETVADLQLRIEKDSNITVADQELLLEAGLALEPQALATQCAMDYSVILNSLDNASSWTEAHDEGLSYLLFACVGNWRATDRLTSGFPVCPFHVQLWTPVCSSCPTWKHPLRPWVHPCKTWCEDTLHIRTAFCCPTYFQYKNHIF